MTESKFQFSNPFLTKMVFEFNEDFHPKDEPSEKQFPLKTNVKIRRHESQPSALVDLTVDVAEATGEYPFYISATMCAVFTWDGIQQDMVDVLLEKNAPALLLGYLRPYISQITQASPVESVNIPFMNFQDGKEEN